MKVFRVITEHDGATTREPGKISTELVREEFRYAAQTINQVWQHYHSLNFADRTLIAIHEEHPSIEVLK